MSLTAIVIAPGESLTQEQCDATRGYGLTVAVSDAYKLAPWCDAIAANDRAWWRERPDAKAMTCAKYSACSIEGVTQVERTDFVGTGSSSGVLGLWIAKFLGATRILMIGFDNKGAHFFGPHTGSLKNTPAGRFKVFDHQFAHLRNYFKIVNVEARNATPDTALNAIQKTTLAEGLEWLRPSK